MLGVQTLGFLLAMHMLFPSSHLSSAYRACFPVAEGQLAKKALFRVELYKAGTEGPESYTAEQVVEGTQWGLGCRRSSKV